MGLTRAKLSGHRAHHTICCTCASPTKTSTLMHSPCTPHICSAPVHPQQRHRHSCTHSSLAGKLLPSEAKIYHTSVEIGCLLLLAHTLGLFFFGCRAIVEIRAICLN